MKQLFGLLLIALPAWSYAQTREVSAFYANLQGDWQAESSASERYQVTYTVTSQGLHVQGQECKETGYDGCYFIEADYLLSDRGVMRYYPTYGAQQVVVKTITPTMIEKVEINPLDPKLSLVVRETLLDASTLEIRREVWRAGASVSEASKRIAADEPVVLRRTSEPTGVTSANTEAGGVIQ